MNCMSVYQTNFDVLSFGQEKYDTCKKLNVYSMAFHILISNSLFRMKCKSYWEIEICSRLD